MNVFRIFFVSVVLIPVLVVVVTSDESGIRLRKPRSIVISEDGTRSAKRHNPVTILDKNCPALGCTGNLTTSEYNGKGSLALTLLPQNGDRLISNFSKAKERRFVDSSLNSSLPFRHAHPFKLEIKSIKNSTRSDIGEYIVASDFNETELARAGFFTYAVFVSFAFYWTWKIILTFMAYFTISYVWNYFRRQYGIGDDYIEYYVKLGQDPKHPFHSYGGGWNPTFGISLKSKIEDLHHGWQFWKGYKGLKALKQGWKKAVSSLPHHHGHHHHHHLTSSYHGHHHHQGGWPQPYHAGAQDYGWPAPAWPAPMPGWSSWSAPPPQKGWTDSEEEEAELKHKFDMRKGWKIAKKYTKKYGKKAHKYGLKPSKHSYMYNEGGNIILGGHDFGYAWKRRGELDTGKDVKNKTSKTD